MKKIKLGIWWGIFFYSFALEEGGKVKISISNPLNSETNSNSYTYEECEKFATDVCCPCPVYKEALRYFPQEEENEP